MIMKKMWRLAVVALAVFAFVACGGSTEKKAEPSVKDCANEFAQKMCNAAKSNDVAKVEKLENEIDKYVDGLDEERPRNSSRLLQRSVLNWQAKL
jgi:uncharacterized membrane protein (DUF106 family)